MSPRTEVWQGTLALMVLKTLSAMGPQHGYGIARRIEQTSDDMLSINEGTLYPVLLKLEQERAIASPAPGRSCSTPKSASGRRPTTSSAVSSP